MGIIDAWRERGRANKAVRLLSSGDPLGDTVLNELLPDSRRDVLLQVARAWREDRFDDAMSLVDRVLRDAPDHPAALRLGAELKREAGQADASAGLLERLIALAPKEESLLLEWADVLIDADRSEEALHVLEPLREGSGPLVLLRVGKALFASDRSEEALEVLDHAMEAADALRRSDPFGADITVGDPQFDELRALHREVLAEVHGREAVTVDMALRRNLDSRAGVNFKLLAASVMKSRPCAAVSVSLMSNAEERTTGERLIRADSRDPRGHILVGSSFMREGEFGKALDHFDRAEALKPLHFAAVLGRGAALALREQRADEVITKRLPHPPPELDSWQNVLPELPRLTRSERRVIAASITPLRRIKPQLDATGAYVRILPIDTLTTDLPEFADAREARHESDHRSYDCITGMAHGKVAVVKIEELLDVEGEDGWTFAHELAHVVLEVMPAEFVTAVERLYERFCATGFVGGEYQLSNVHEFFACGYADYLREVNGTTAYVHDDEHGLLRELFGVFRALGE